MLRATAKPRPSVARGDDPVAGPIADERHAPATEVGGDQLTVGSDFEDELRLDQMHAIALYAAVPGRAKLCHAGVVEARRGVRRLDRGPGRGDARARLARVDRRSDSGREQIYPQLLRDVGQTQR